MKIIDKVIVFWNIFRFKHAGIKFGNGLRVRGHIQLQVHKGGIAKMGKNAVINSGNMSNPMGRNICSSIRVHDGATLSIGDNFGMSSGCLWVSMGITIGNNVKVGALTIITDTDAHSINPVYRASSKTDFADANKAPILIKDNAFIGANCFVCKGVTIGENSIVGACSVVTKSIPDNEIWGGNPARFIKKLIFNENIDTGE